MNGNPPQEAFRYKGYRCTVYFTGVEGRYSGFAEHPSGEPYFNAPSLADRQRVINFIQTKIDHLVTQ